MSLRNSALDARPFSLTGEDTRKAAYAQARMGAVLGGPLRIPKLLKGDNTSFFLNFFLTRSRSPYQGTATVPTLLERSGDFSQSFTRTPVSIFDPTTGAPFVGNRIPIDRMNSAALGLLSFIPLPNHLGQVQNYQRYLNQLNAQTANGGSALNDDGDRKSVV